MQAYNNSSNWKHILVTLTIQAYITIAMNWINILVTSSIQEYKHIALNYIKNI